MRRLATLVLIGLLQPVAARAQASDTARSLLTLSELDDDQKTHPVRRAVDVNSRITIEIQRDALRSRAADYGGSPAVAARLAEMRALQGIARDGRDALPEAADALRDYAADPDAPGAAFGVAGALAPLADALQRLDRLVPRGTPLRAELNAALDAPPGESNVDRAARALDITARRAEAIRAAVDSLLAEEGVAVQLGAWLVTDGGERPIHLEGFDRYPEGEVFEVERFSFALDSAEQANLAELEGEARTADVADLAGRLAAPFTTVVDSARGALDRCRSELDEAFAALEAAPADVRGDAERLRSALASLRAELQNVAAARSVSATELPRRASVALASVVASAERVVTALERLAASAEQATGEAAGRVVDAADRCRSAVEARVEAAAGYASALGSIFTDAARVDAAALEFGEEVQRLELASVPGSTSFPLRRAGPREAGDRVIIKLALVTDEQRHVLTTRSFAVDRVISTVDATPGMVFADPLAAGTGVSRRFQPAASYSLLLSWGSRRSTLYNRLFRFGIGFNMAALDFDKDDTPELGVGLVLSFLNRIGQVGVGYNTSQDVSYWFFGLQLPSPSFRLPGT